MAVVTTDALTDTESGRFHCALPPPFPPNCLEEIVYPCLSDDDCTGEFGPDWVCKKPPLGVQYQTNANGSLNSTCRYKCTDDAGCMDAFSQDPSEVFQCIKPGGDPDAAGCLQPPNVADCPTDLPCVVSTADGTLDELACTLVVGALQDKNPQLEQGLKAAVWALASDNASCAPNNVEQAEAFLRPDAHVLVVFVSDEDDCSLACDEEVMAVQFSQCGCLDDADHGGPLEPVGDLADDLRSAAADPSQILVAAIVGGVLVTPSATGGALTCPDPAFATTEACVESKEAAFVDSKCCNGPYCANTYVCSSDLGKADLGSRYHAFAAEFSDNGFVANLCDPAGLGDTLDSVATWVLSRL
jgi:hypothetical protein